MPRQRTMINWRRILLEYMEWGYRSFLWPESQESDKCTTSMVGKDTEFMAYGSSILPIRIFPLPIHFHSIHHRTYIRTLWRLFLLHKHHYPTTSSLHIHHHCFSRSIDADAQYDIGELDCLKNKRCYTEQSSRWHECQLAKSSSCWWFCIQCVNGLDREGWVS